MSTMTSVFMTRLAWSTLWVAIAATVAWLLLRTFRCRSPRIEAAVWWLVLLQGLVLFPVSIAVPSSWTESLGLVGESRRVASNPPPIQRHSKTLSQTSHAVDDLEQQPTESIPVATVAPVAAPLGSDRPSTSSGIFGWLTGFIWVCGVLFVLFRWAADYWRFLYLSESTECDLDIWNDEWKRLLQQRGIEVSIPLHVSQVVGPALIRAPRGYRIVVPFTLWNTLSSVERESVLLHELAHFQRNDLLKSLMAHMLAALHWFNPLAWLAVHRLESCMELSCDDQVRRASHPGATHYASALLTAMEHRGRTPAVARAAMGGQIGDRIRRLLGSEDATKARWPAALILLIPLTLLAIRAVRLEAAEPQQTSAATVVDSPADENQDKVKEQVADKGQPVDEVKRELAAKRLRQLGGKVRFFHKPDHPQHWVQIILETQQPLEGEIKRTRDFTPAGPFDDGTMTLVRTLSLNAPTNLHLRNTEVTSMGLAKLRGTRVRRLSLIGKSTNDKSLEQLIQLPDLNDLSLGETRVTNSGLRTLRDCRKLTTLSLAGAALNNKGLTKILSMKQLRALTLGSSFGDESAKLVSQLPNLERLNVSEVVTSRFFRDLQQLPNLKRLSISGNNIDDSAIRFLCQKATRLEELYVRRAKVTDASVKLITHLEKLRVVCFDGCAITDAGLPYLLEMPNVRWLDLSSTKVTDKGLATIGKLKGLRQLFLMATGISEDGLGHLKGLEDLVHLSLSGNMIQNLPPWMKDRPRLYVSK